MALCDTGFLLKNLGIAGERYRFIWPKIKRLVKE